MIQPPLDNLYDDLFTLQQFPPPSRRKRFTAALRELLRELFSKEEIIGIGIVFLLTLLLLAASAITIYSAYNGITLQ